MKALCCILLYALLPVYSYAQTDTLVPQQPAEDFVIASVCVATPGDDIYAALGHACLRLQCPTHGLDYVYSYEAEDVNHNVARFFAGKLKMAVRTVPTEEYIAQYVPQGRGVKEYVLNLPVRVKQRLWEQMDARSEYSPIPYDYMNNGCAVSVLSWLEDAIGKDSLEYGPWPEKFNRSRKEMGGDSIRNKWNHIFVCTFVTGEANSLDIENTRKVIVPTELIEVLSDASAFGAPILSGECNVLLKPAKTVRDASFTPLMLSLIVLLLSVLNLRLRKGWLRCAVLVPCLLLGTFVLYLVVLSDLPCTQWNWLVIPFCPLPFIFWKWRRYWVLPFAVMCVVWVVGMLVYPHQIVDDAHLVLAIAMAVCNVEISLNRNNKSK